MRHGFLVAAAVWVIAVAAGIVEPGGDAAKFYAHPLPTPYAVTDYAGGSGFYYAPSVAFLFAPLMAFGLPVFSAILTGSGLLALYWMLGRWAWVGLFFPPVWWDLSAGNVNTLIGAAAIAGTGWWSVALLTKVTPGVGILWHLVRGERRELAVAVGVTGALCAASFVAMPHLWPEWIASLTSNGTGYIGPGYFTVPVPIVPRLVAAVVVVAWGARAGRRWTIPVAVTLAMPVLWFSALAPLVGVASQHHGVVGRVERRVGRVAREGHGARAVERGGA